MKKAFLVVIVLLSLMMISSPSMGMMGASRVLEDNKIKRGMTQIEVMLILGKPLMKNDTGKVLVIHEKLIFGTDIIEWFYKMHCWKDYEYLYCFLFVANTLVAVSAKRKGEDEWVLLTQY